MYRSIVRFIVAINAICSKEIRCRKDSSILTQLKVGEHTPRLSCSLPLLVSHGVLSLSGNTEVYCSVLVSGLSLSLFLYPPPHPAIFSTTLSTQPLTTSVRLSLLCISSFPPSLLLSSLPFIFTFPIQWDSVSQAHVQFNQDTIVLSRPKPKLRSELHRTH